MIAERILLMGDFDHGRLGESYERALRTSGHEVYRFDVGRERRALAWPARNRILHRAAIGNLTTRRNWSRVYNQRLLDAARQADVPWVFIHNGEWLMPETVRTLRDEGRKVAIFHADNPFPPHYNNRPETLPAAREADLYLIWSERLAEKLRCEGVNAHFLAFGWDPEVFPYQGSILQGTRKIVVFIGGWDRERETFLDEIAKHVPLEIYGPAYWGTRTRRSSRARACWQGRALGGAEAARVWRESAVSLNILRTQHCIDGRYDGVIMRHFEVPGAGGFLLSTRDGVATELFPEGQAGAYFNNVGDCIRKCSAFLEDEKSRLSIAARSHLIVDTEHGYSHRATEFVHLIRSLDRAKAPRSDEQRVCDPPLGASRTSA